MHEQQPSYESLLARVKELEVLNKELLEQKALEDRLDYAWAGNLGHWYLNLKTQVVVFNPLKLTSLGYTFDEIETPVRFSFFTSKLHPEDYLKAMNAMRDHMAGKVPVYEIEYRIRHKDGSYKWFHDRGKITQSDEDGTPVLVSG
ncbi:MAG: PAS domain S-box protein, partial [Methanomicrobia archaeon]|nr:PAS domain S-box protein [Methanomicrobia archaeon]